MRTVLFLLCLLALQSIAFSDNVVEPMNRGDKIIVPQQCRNIQRAIKSASNGDTIIVSPGTYRENIDFLGKSITLKSEQGPAVTIIDGGQNGSVVEFTKGEDSHAVLNGFTVTNGYGMVWTKSAGDGGGIYCDNASPTIINNVITGNFASSGYGGGIFIKSNSAPIVAYNTITDNSSIQCGSGIYCRSSTPYILYNTISKNRSMLGFGGAITCSLGSKAYIVSNTMLGNWAKAGGGGICVYQSSPVITGNILAGNTTLAAGGGILVFWSSAPEITNNTISRNEAEDGGGIACKNHASATVSNTIIWNNDAQVGREIYLGKSNSPATLDIAHSNVDMTLGSIFSDTNCFINTGPGIISSDPYFVDPSNDDFHLTIYSPCINVGDNTVDTLPSTDFEHNPRIAPVQSGTTDIGADEFYHHLYTKGTAEAGGEIELVVIGYPNVPATLYIRPIVADPPSQGGSGIFNLYAFWDEWKLGPIPLSGVLRQNVAVPPSAAPGDRFRLFVTEGYFFNGGPLVRTNEMELTIE